jgi:hypothetical protein
VNKKAFRYNGAFNPSKQWQKLGASHGYQAFAFLQGKDQYVGDIYRIYDGTRADGWWVPSTDPGKRFKTRRAATLQVVAQATSEQKAVEDLNKIPADDPVVAHSTADDILLSLVSEEVRLAYQAVVDRCDWWANA